MPRKNPLDPPKPGVTEAVRRGLSYELLARTLAYPDPGALESIRDVAGLSLALHPEGPVSELARAFIDHSRSDLEAEYIELFTLATSPDCPTYESAYVCTDINQQTSIMADVSGFYRAFGLELGQGLRPDDISLELEFLGFLCRKEAYAIEHMGKPRVLQARRNQRVFISEHLGRWGETLGHLIAGHAAAGSPYQALGAALAAWVEAERRLAGVLDAAVVARPAMPFPDQRRDVGPNNASLITAEQILETR
ncbi:MAG: molecular chaperone [Dehalococcoidia bacterium]